ncbi:hypothetical protein FACS1894184_11490 [Clostridia bacterium]|nr:hypothetical protein FACS1894184_11490 [Clostridia bacterium]
MTYTRKTILTRVLCTLLAALMLAVLLPGLTLAEIGVVLVNEDGTVEYEAVPGFSDMEQELAEIAPDFGPIVTPEPTETPRVGLRALPVPAAAAPVYPGTLIKYGQKGAAVTLIQTRLKELGYFLGAVTGNFLDQTLVYVKTFQQRNALAADGIIGPASWAKLFHDPNVISAGQTTPPPTASTPYRITIDVVNQIVTVYGKDSKGAYTNIVKKFICSTGTASYPTPVSTFVLNGRTARWCYFPEWGSHAQYWTRINSSIAFHSVIYTKAATNALVLSSYTALGTPASHGCIRLLVADAKWIYDNVGAGTVVESFRGVSDPEGTMLLKPGPIEASTNLPKATPQPTALPVFNSQQLPPQPFRTLKTGLTGLDVFWLQSRLTEIGLYKGSVTGGYYGGTTNAVKAYQRANGLTADGLAGVKTQTSLYSYILNAPRMLSVMLTPDETPEPSATPEITPTPTATPPPTVTASPEPTATPEPTAEPAA